MEIPSKSIGWLRRDTEREYKYAINLFKNFGLVPLDLAGLGCGTQFAAGRENRRLALAVIRLERVALHMKCCLAKFRCNDPVDAPG